MRHGQRSLLKLATLAIALLCNARGKTQTGGAAGKATILDVCAKDMSAADLDGRIDALIAKMTLAERVSQLGDRAPAIPRLNVPGYNWWNEGLHGLARDGYATVFPQAIGLAATWDPDLLHQVGESVSTEAREHFARQSKSGSQRYAGLTIWSPNINLFRDPRWGRGQETYGEDPVLTGTLAAQFVRGIQGDDPFYLRADATPKHFAVHSGPEEGRDSFNAVVSPHDLNDSYFRAFHQVVSDAHAAALMCSYNAINGTPSCANQANLEGTIRSKWGFRGYVVSDCDAVGNIHAYHHYAPDAAHGAALALNAGVDLDCGSSYDALAQSVAQGLVTEAAIDRALHRLLLARARLGLLDASTCSPYSEGTRSDLEEAHSALALRAAEESAVLLRNNGALPLKPESRIAVVGPTADMLRVLEANYHGTARKPVTLLQGIQGAFPHATYAQGSTLAEGVTLPVPRTALRSSEVPGAPAGLHAEYFDHPSVEGPPDVTTTVPTLDLDLDRVGPTPAITAKRYAARWTGVLETPSAGNFVIRVNVERCWDCKEHDTYRLYVDGKQALDNSGGKGTPDRITLHDERATAHRLRLEYLHTGEDEGIALEWLPDADGLRNEAVATARNADVVVAVLGLSPDLEGEALSIKTDGFEGGDRTSLNLPAAQAQLLRALERLGKPLVVVLTSGSAIALDESERPADAVLEMWYPGQAGGTALARLLSGAANPSGRLPVTFYRSVSDLPPFGDYSMAGRTYRYFNKPTLYQFGYGLSYSSFQYSGTSLDKKDVTPGAEAHISATVTNQSERPGAEVVQLYVTPPQVPGAPRLALQAFQRVQLAPHESRVVTFPIGAAQLRTVAPDGQARVQQGEYGIFVGGAQPSYQDRAKLKLRVRRSWNLP